MTLKLPLEILTALQQQPGLAVRVLDDETQKAYLVVPEDSLPTLWENFVRAEVQKGLSAIGCGEAADWNIEETIAEAQRRRAARAS